MSDDRHDEDPPEHLIVLRAVLLDYSQVQLCVRVHSQPIGSPNASLLVEETNES